MFELFFSTVTMQLLTHSKAASQNVAFHDQHNPGQNISVDFTHTVQHILLLSNIKEVIYLKHEGKYLL